MPFRTVFLSTVWGISVDEQTRQLSTVDCRLLAPVGWLWKNGLTTTTCLGSYTLHWSIVSLHSAAHWTEQNAAALHCTALHWAALNCTGLHCTALQCTVLHCLALNCTALHRTPLLCTALHCTALHCTALHCTALHCTVLQCAAVHCTALIQYFDKIFIHHRRHPPNLFFLSIQKEILQNIILTMTWKPFV